MTIHYREEYYMSSNRSNPTLELKVYNVSFFLPLPEKNQNEGLSTQQYDFSLEFEQLLASATAGNISAQVLVGCSLLYGWKGCAINYSEGVKWISLAKQRTDVPAGLFAQGICYQDAMCEVVIKDLDKAAKCFVQAGNAGYIPARSRLITFFEEGYGNIQKDIHQAIKIAIECATHGYAPAQQRLAVFHLKGTGIPKDYREAFKLFHLAAENGHAYARDYLGDMYRYGWGVPIDYSQAKAWYRLAANQGLQSAIKSLNELTSCCCNIL